MRFSTLSPFLDVSVHCTRALQQPVHRRASGREEVSLRVGRLERPALHRPRRNASACPSPQNPHPPHTRPQLPGYCSEEVRRMTDSMYRRGHGRFSHSSRVSSWLTSW